MALTSGRGAPAAAVLREVRVVQLVRAVDRAVPVQHRARLLYDRLW